MAHRAKRGPSARLAVVVQGRREGAGLTQHQLAVRAGVSVGTVRDIEQGRTTTPHANSLAGLAIALGLSRDELDDSPPGDSRATAGPARSEKEGAAPGALRLAVLGPLAASRGGVPLQLGSVRQRAVLGLLALHASDGLSREAIVDALWGQRPPRAAAGMVQKYVSQLRRLAGPGGGPEAAPPGRPRVVCWEGGRYRLTAEICSDVAEFDELAEWARRAATDRDAGLACRLFEQAIALWRGEPLAGLEVLAAHSAVADLARRRIAVVVEFADVATTAGMTGRALGQLRAAAQLEVLDERVHARLMVALAATGQQAAALAVFEELRERLDQELGVRPGPELAEMHVRVLRQEIPATVRAVSGTTWPAMTATGAAAIAEAAGNGHGEARAHAAVAPRQLPPLGTTLAGRADELTVLDALRRRPPSGPGSVMISVISGTAGVGKTALAVYWAHQVADTFPSGQLYANLRGFGPGRDPVPPGEVLREFLGALGLPAEAIPAELDARTALYRTVLAGRQMLILLDNARDAEQVRPLLPSSSGCMVLVTSRSWLAGLAAAEAAVPITLDVLTQADAQALLAQRLSAERLHQEQAAAEELAAQCARLPLALSVAAARAAEHPGFLLDAVVTELRDKQHRLDALETGDPTSGVRAVLSWSYESLSGPAARLFRLAAAAHPGPDLTAPAAASLAGISLPEARRTLAELVRASLLTEQAVGRFSCHDLLRAYAAELSQARDTDADRDAALRRILDHYLHACASLSRLFETPRRQVCLAPPAPGVQPEAFADRPRALTWLEAERPTLLAAVDQAERAGFDVHAWQLGWAMAYAFTSQCWWHDLADVQRSAVRAATRLGDRTAQAHALHGLGRVLGLTGRAAEGCKKLSQAAAIFADLEDDNSRATALHHLALTLAEDGRYSDAIEHSGKACELFRAVGSPNGEAGALNNIGWFHLQLGEYEQALPFIRQAVRTFRQLGDRHGEAIALDSLGWTHHHLGHQTLAVACLRQALSAVREFSDRRVQANILSNLGDAHDAVGQTAAARHDWTEALSTLQGQDPALINRLRVRLGQ
ncbi:MAG: BTAD domain-containing putative transcriptional regulator [Streptosporangiaceae bacterium]